MKALWLLSAYACGVAGFGWLALTMEPHWHLVRGGLMPGRAAVLRLRVLGALGLLLSLGACLRADHVTMAALVWVMTLAASALSVTFVLSWRPTLLAPLVAWMPAARPDPTSGQRL